MRPHLVYCLVPALLWGVIACAESTDCSNPSLIVPDGRINQSVFAAATPEKAMTYWYGFYAQAGHSYSVEFVSPTDNYPYQIGGPVSFSSFYIWAPGVDKYWCNQQSTLSTTRTESYAPVLMHSPGYGDGERLSFIASTSGLHALTISNSGGAGNYSFRVVDTTLFNPRWSTWSGYDTQWGLQNLSDMSISGVFTIYDASNKLLRSSATTVPAGGEVMRFTNSSDFNLARNTNGYAMFAYVGPPGAILADAYMLNSSGTIVIYAKFEHPSP